MMMNSFRWTGFSFIGWLSLAVISVMPVRLAMANQLDFAHIQTSGFGEVKVVPDQALLRLRVEEHGKTAKEVKSAADSSVNSLLELWLSAGIKREQIESSNLHIAPQYHYAKNDRPRELAGYKASRSITLHVDDISQLEQYMDIAMTAGVNRVDSITLQSSQFEQHQQRALQLAIEDAKAKAARLAAGFDRKVEQVWRIDYSPARVQPMRAQAMDSQVKTDSYQDQSIAINERVDVIFKLAQ
ncbi:SIMPL domain-containing protein [Vibrio sp. WXL210]|uniref:SIMPL domain-containing protein n=1 Tax=Vibrio sp. WXL210 TaxID=3450709 RepID=UPI003EC69F3F